MQHTCPVGLELRGGLGLQPKGDVYDRSEISSHFITDQARQATYSSAGTPRVALAAARLAYEHPTSRRRESCLTPLSSGRRAAPRPLSAQGSAYMTRLMMRVMKRRSLLLLVRTTNTITVPVGLASGARRRGPYPRKAQRT